MGKPIGFFVWRSDVAVDLTPSPWMGEGWGEGGAGSFDVSGRLCRQPLTLPSPTRGEGITHVRILAFGKSRQRQLKN